MSVKFVYFIVQASDEHARKTKYNSVFQLKTWDMPSGGSQGIHGISGIIKKLLLTTDKDRN
jgi:hypothetical protein